MKLHRIALPLSVLGFSLLGLTGCATNGAPHSVGVGDDHAHIMALLKESPLIDGHNDLPWAYRERVHNHVDQIDLSAGTATLDKPMHTDLPRLRAGGLGAQFWSVYISIDQPNGKPGDVRTVLEQIDVAKRIINQYDDLELALTADDIERIHHAGRIASLLGMEGGQSIENSLAALRATYELGARYMTLTHWRNLAWADSATDEKNVGGLTEFGRDVVGEMNRLGMLVDLSHVSADTMNDALDVTEAPVIFSHSAARAIDDHPRNVPDQVLKRLKDNGGVVMVTFVPTFISQELRTWSQDRSAKEKELRDRFGDDDNRVIAQRGAWEATHPKPTATLAQVADHIDHVRAVAGIDHVGIGGDFDGIDAGPKGLEDVSKYPDLFVELMRRGYSDADLKKIAGQNLLRVMRGAERAAARLQRERSPDDTLIEEADGKNPFEK